MFFLFFGVISPPSKASEERFTAGPCVQACVVEKGAVLTGDPSMNP